MSVQAKGDGWYQLDAVRLALSLCVVWSHWLQIFLFPFGLVGASAYQASRDCAWWSVVAFFSLSGLVIGRSLQRDGDLDHDALLDFLRRRVRRIYPALIFSVALSACIGLALAAAGTASYHGVALAPPRTAYRYLTLLPDVATSLLRFGFAPVGTMAGDSNGPLWSLQLEMQSYVIAALGFHVAMARHAAWRLVCAASLAAIGAWLYDLARCDMLGLPYFAAFFFGFAFSFLPIRFPAVLPRLPADVSYSLYITHFPTMLLFFFLCLQGAPSPWRVGLVAACGLVTALLVAFGCARWVEHRWRSGRGSSGSVPDVVPIFPTLLKAGPAPRSATFR